MAVPAVLSELQSAVLAQLADTFAPAVEVAEDPHGFWARTASDMGVPAAMEDFMADLPEEELEGLRGLLDALHAQGFEQAPAEMREAIVLGFMDSSP